MTLRTLLSAALLSTAMVVPAVFAQSVGTNCDQATGGKYQPGTDAWRTCYINSAIAMCSANPPQTYHSLRPFGGCNETSLSGSMSGSWGMREQVCTYEFDKGYLPNGVTVEGCEQDWGCYIGKTSCS